MQNKLYIIGVGPGSDKYVLPAARDIINSCDVLIGGKRNLESFMALNKEIRIIGANLTEVIDYIHDNISTKKIAVLVSGDTGIHSMLGFIKRNASDLEIEVIPGISSLQYFASKLGIEWSDLNIVSVHGRTDENVINEVANSEKTFIFTGGKFSPASICKKIMEAGIFDLKVYVGENLSYPYEKIVEGSLEKISQMTFEALSVMLVINNKAREWGYLTQGIPDDLFIRSNVPMTKEEIRALSISKLRLTGANRVLDIGAGTGSIAVECGLLSKKGKVYAVEKEEEGISLIKENAKKFEAYNVEVIHGKAPEALEGLLQVDRVFIGGSGGQMEDIITWIKRNKCARVVINTITVESTYETLTALENEGFSDIEIINVSVSKGRKIGGKHLMQALNPIYIISAEINS